VEEQYLSSRILKDLVTKSIGHFRATGSHVITIVVMGIDFTEDLVPGS
jgi:hypothetical protein